ncbi:peptide-methionine (S)-S-oxide reductase MsrA [Hippea maritima]|uniref:Peptide methionine sulfoxide reductase MsrA n=1 Tax=Hippea maritima (strain ATCC 700847 / DSM 10411 / MH2) TaxID=760142 RepID=F2LVH7_HIPMA|nr:peptide-methionine (S)-S-oxide reductase MsrA [Hippea maritima]AEA33761.1 Peptide methionine sulfoxide reductase msrA [Hippea maritima DSM 10411]
MRNIAVFAGGCFWCLEKVYSDLDGVVDLKVGYTGGKLKNPTYDKVSSGLSGHFEAIKFVFEQGIVDYKVLLKLFWLNIDPTDADGQFCDVGNQYRSAIFYTTDRQKELAFMSKGVLEESNLFEKPITTLILPFEEFYEAEDYHQRYFEKNPKLYRQYYEFSGRVCFFNRWRSRIEEVLDKHFLKN